jgi:hypothetical protein
MLRVPGVKVRQAILLLIAFLLLSAGSVKAAGPARMPLIANGDPVESPSEAPWSTLINVLGDNRIGVCSGSIIDSMHVLTAAHCTFHEQASAPPSSYVVSAGFSAVESLDELQQRRVTAVEVSPGYDPSVWLSGSDAAVLTLDEPFDFGSPGVRPIAVVPERGQLPPGSPVKLYGWGKVSEGQPEGREYSLDLSLLRQWKCGGTRAILCARSETGANCRGDSGGGLVSMSDPPVLLGVTSSGTVGCLPGTTGNYADMASPELHSWLLGNDNPPQAPEPYSKPEVVGYVGVGGSASCRHPGWSGQPRLKTLFVYPGNEVEAAATAKQVFGRADVGKAIACVSIASNAGGTTESDLSALRIIAGRTAELVEPLGRSWTQHGWRVRVRLPRALAGTSVRVGWQARSCARCRAAGAVDARRKLTLRAPRSWPSSATLLSLRVPAVKLGGIPYRASTFRLWLPSK